ncbi:hypothetical protein NYR54_04140 [Chelativorans sp. SCAU2101]|uniref:Uncharacterized protein n=1 Tax=Chelativorans petroleitrophicus TaxID=2975484 RepID=A0A9X2X7F6_9HYPH|nr:hypothetical protein [Chelativorans petroleitrophicus]MCT8989489.1 hypothetical protein [Chelativorans petroleitrophicus]
MGASVREEERAGKGGEVFGNIGVREIETVRHAVTNRPLRASGAARGMPMRRMSAP